MTAPGRLANWNARLDDPIDLRALAFLRIALGPIVLLHLRPFLVAATDGIVYSDRFYLPFFDWLPMVSRGWYVGLLWLTAGAAVALCVGLWSRVAAAIALTGVTYNLLLSQTHFHHNRAFLIILLAAVTVLPVGRTISLDAVLARRRGAPLATSGGSRLALSVIRLEIATVYLASGFSKLIDADWWGGTVTRLRVVQHRGRLADVGLPDAIIDVLAGPAFQSVAAKVVVLTELFIGLGLLIKRTRRSAVWVAVAFHVLIQATAAVQVFSVAALSALVVWIDHPSKSVVVEGRASSIRLIRLLDWTGRFDVRPTTQALRVIHGTDSIEGRAARWFVATRLPATFWFAAPISAFSRT